MRDTTNTVFLCHHSPQLKVEDTQSFTFTAKDNGQWFLSIKQREIKQLDQPTNKVKQLEGAKNSLQQL